MKAVKNWQLLRQNADGITLLCDERHLLHIIVLEQHLWRIWLLQERRSRLDRTWMISPETAPTPDTGRRRASREGFNCPPVAILDNGDHVILEGDTIRLTITRPLMLTWAEKTPTGWRPLAADRKTDAYMLGHSRTRICHYLRLFPEDKYFGLGEKAGTVNRFGKRYEMRSLDAMGYNAETSDPLYKHWPFYHTVTPAGGHYGIFYDNLNNAWFNLGKEIDNYHGRFRSYLAEDGDLDYYQGNYHCGGQTLTMPASLERLLIFVRAGSVIPESRLLHADSAARDNLSILRIFTPMGHQRLSGTIFDDDGSNSKNEDYRLYWTLATTASDIHLELHSSGGYRPAYLSNLQVTLPQHERRTLSISGNVLIQPGDAS